MLVTRVCVVLQVVSCQKIAVGQHHLRPGLFVKQQDAKAAEEKKPMETKCTCKVTHVVG